MCLHTQTKINIHTHTLTQIYRKRRPAAAVWAFGVRDDWRFVYTVPNTHYICLCGGYSRQFSVLQSAVATAVAAIVFCDIIIILLLFLMFRCSLRLCATANIWHLGTRRLRVTYTAITTDGPGIIETERWFCATNAKKIIDNNLPWRF